MLHAHSASGLEVEAQLLEDAGAIWGDGNGCADLIGETGAFENLGAI